MFETMQSIEDEVTKKTKYDKYVNETTGEINMN